MEDKNKDLSTLRKEHAKKRKLAKEQKTAKQEEKAEKRKEEENLKIQNCKYHQAAAAAECAVILWHSS